MASRSSSFSRRRSRRRRAFWRSSEACEAKTVRVSRESLVEEVPDAVVPQVDGAEHLAAGQERSAHHRLEAEVHHRGGAGPLGVVQGVGDDQRPTRREHLLDDGVGDAGYRLLHVSGRDVPGGPDLRLPVDELDHEALVGPGHLEERIEQGVEERLERSGFQEASREPDQRVLARGGAGAGRGRSGGRGREVQLVPGGPENVPGGQAAGGPAAPVHGQFHPGVGGDGEGLPVGEHVERRGRKRRVVDGQVALRVAAHGGDPACQLDHPGGAVAGLEDEFRHVHPS